MKVLFVCYGNICRSPLAEAMFNQEVQAAGLANRVTVASVATGDHERGNRPHPGIEKIMQKYHLNDRGHRSRQITAADFAKSDLIIGMDDQNLADLRRMAPAADRGKIFGINDHTPGHQGEPIPDPWYSHRFQETYDALQRALPNWLAVVKDRLQSTATE